MNNKQSFHSSVAYGAKDTGGGGMKEIHKPIKIKKMKKRKEMVAINTI
jgi:hypothetical protein